MNRNFLEGVYWDLDGTIANTELEAHLPAFNDSFNDFGLDWKWDINCYIELLKINGGKNRISHYSNLRNQSLNNDLVVKIHERKQYHYLNLIRNNAVCLKIGVHRLIKELKSKGIRQFIVTSSSRKQVELLVENLFKEFNPFEFIISSDDVEIHKPDPLPYIKATQLSGIKKYKSIVFEDSNAGLKSSLTAHLPTIFIPSNIPTVIEKEINLDCIINHLGDHNNVTNIIKGPKLIGDHIDYSYLNDYLKLISNAKNKVFKN